MAKRTWMPLSSPDQISPLTWLALKSCVSLSRTPMVKPYTSVTVKAVVASSCPAILGTVSKLLATPSASRTSHSTVISLFSLALTPLSVNSLYRDSGLNSEYGDHARKSLSVLPTRASMLLFFLFWICTSTTVSGPGYADSWTPSFLTLLSPTKRSAVSMEPAFRAGGTTVTVASGEN